MPTLYERIMLQLLKFSGDEKEHSMREATEYISTLFELGEEVAGIKIDPIHFLTRPRTHLEKAGLLESTSRIRRGDFRITDRGLEVLEQNPSEINDEYLEQFPEFVEFVARGGIGAEERRRRFWTGLVWVFLFMFLFLFLFGLFGVVGGIVSIIILFVYAIIKGGIGQ